MHPLSLVAADLRGKRAAYCSLARFCRLGGLEGTVFTLGARWASSTGTSRVSRMTGTHEAFGRTRTMATLPWTAGETLLALGLAHHLEWTNPSEGTPAVVGLSRLLAQGPFHPGITLPGLP